ncbi:MAG: c(7)-type cytochrome triheme domain-containing protein [Acidobacteriota bacterium]
MRSIDRSTTCLLLVLWVCTLASCAPVSRYRVLSFFFDGVPHPEEKAAREAEAAAALAQAALELEAETPAVEVAMLPDPGGIDMLVRGAEDQPPLPSLAPSLPIENFRAWGQVLAALPKTSDGGADWVEAIKQGVIAPRARVDWQTPLEPPFTLDTVVPGIASGWKPPFTLDIELTSEKAPLFKAVFPHSSHTLWLNCSSCHPGAVRQRAGMARILAGESCGGCHGKVAFDPQLACARCHVNLVPEERETITSDLARAGREPIPGTAGILERGRVVYSEACATCHGEKGDGKGSLAEWLDPRPRDFTAGKFKFRSTPGTSIPTDFDLFQIITRGIPGTSMLGWSSLSYEDRWSLVHFIKTFSERLSSKEPADPVPVPDPPPSTPELVRMGADLYTQAGCHSCHGDTGRGDGPSAPSLVDDWGHRLRPYDFTGAMPPKAGANPRDLYRTLMTGLQGTPMPDYGDIFEPEQAWAIVYHVLSLGEESRKVGFGMKGEVLFARQPKEGEVLPARFPHWFHRVRFRCTACHPGVFEMKAGAATMTMDAMREGRFCATCHNGRTAWEIAFDNCTRCHAGE